MTPALRKALALLLLASLPATSATSQGPCTTGCEVSYHLGITQDASYGLDGELVQVSVTSSGGDCVPVLGEVGVYCVSSGCDTVVSYDVAGMAPDAEVWECHARALPVQRTDCRTPPPLTDVNGASSTTDEPAVPCGTGTHTFQITCTGLSAQVQITCEACDLRGTSTCPCS